MIDLRVDVNGVVLPNPVMPASGTFAEGLADIMPFDELGAMVTKTVTREIRAGNSMPRVAETVGGMLNSIGIPSKGLGYFTEHTLPFFRRYAVPLVVSLSAPTVDAFAEDAKILAEAGGITAIEANISCPNLEAGGKAFAMSCSATAQVVKRLREAVALPLWIKLTPNVGDITEVARAAEDQGADALVVANTLLGMSIGVETRRPSLGNVMGGLSGPAIKPVIVRMVYQCARAVRIPIIGCGGISTADDAIEYMLAGATAVQVGTATFLDPTSMIRIISGIREYCARHEISGVSQVIGGVSVPPVSALAPGLTPEPQSAEA